MLWTYVTHRKLAQREEDFPNLVRKPLISLTTGNDHENIMNEHLVVIFPDQIPKVQTDYTLEKKSILVETLGHNNRTFYQTVKNTLVSRAKLIKFLSMNEVVCGRLIN